MRTQALDSGRQSLSLTAWAADPAAGPGSPSTRSPRAGRPPRAVVRGGVRKPGTGLPHGGGAARPRRRARPRMRDRVTARDALRTAVTSPALGAALRPMRSCVSAGPLCHVPLRMPVPSPLPAPPLVPMPSRTRVRPRRDPRRRTPASPADRRRAAGRPLPPESGRSAGAGLRTPPPLSPPASSRRRRRRPRCSGASGCRT